MTDDQERQTVLVATKLTPTMANALRAHALSTRKTVSEIIRDLVDAKLKEYEL